jgi:hypothetical protein
MANGAVYQTLSEFFYNPFGVDASKEIQKLSPKYEKSKARIELHGYAILDDSYYFHIWIPSDSQPGKKYDVVIQFLPPKGIEIESTLDHYVIQFFSNSPSFIYKYAVLYKEKGYMIDALQSKLDPEYAGKAPVVSNAQLALSIDKSIYFAVRFLYENRLTYLSKPSLRYVTKFDFRFLVSSIDDNKTSLGRTAYDIEKEAIKEGKSDRDKITKKVKKALGIKTPEDDNRGIGKKSKKTAVTSTITGGRKSPIQSKKQPIGKNKKITAGRRTGK